MKTKTYSVQALNAQDADHNVVYFPSLYVMLCNGTWCYFVSIRFCHKLKNRKKENSTRRKMKEMNMIKKNRKWKKKQEEEEEEDKVKKMV